MGYLNALAMNTSYLGMPVTPQTGNVLWIGLNAAGGYWHYLLENIALMFGFMGGAVFALFLQNVFKSKRARFYFHWSIFVVPVMSYPFLQYTIHPAIVFFILGFASGAALGFFRKMYHMEINNAMATGNVRFLGLHFALAFLKKDTKDTRKEILTFIIFFISVLLFALGAFCYGIASRLDYRHSLSGMSVTNISLMVFCLFPYLFCPAGTIKNRFISVAIIAVAATTLITLAAYRSSQDSADYPCLTGSWGREGFLWTEIITFEESGYGDLRHYDGGYLNRKAFTWSIIENGMIYLEGTYGDSKTWRWEYGENVKLSYSISGRTLTLTNRATGEEKIFTQRY
jgi:uncharacterized membrane protein YoaK (UPF0700 family)